MSDTMPQGVSQYGEIELRNVTKEFGEEPSVTTAVKDCSFVVERGKFTVLIGPSGCGKTTLINMMAGFVNATAKQQLERKWFPALAETLHAMGNFFKEMGQLDKAPTKEEVEKVMYTKAVEAVAKE